jgi:hypothetical protein
LLDAECFQPRLLCICPAVLCCVLLQLGTGNLTYLLTWPGSQPPLEPVLLTNLHTNTLHQPLARSASGTHRCAVRILPQMSQGTHTIEYCICSAVLCYVLLQLGAGSLSYLLTWPGSQLQLEPVLLAPTRICHTCHGLLHGTHTSESAYVVLCCAVCCCSWVQAT